MNVDIEPIIEESVNGYLDKIKLNDLIQDKAKSLVKDNKTILEIHKLDTIVSTINNPHKDFSNILKLVNGNLPVLLTGEAGVGKTYTAKLIADALGLDFTTISVGEQTTKSDIVGYMNANGIYITTAFRDAFEFGKVFLLDEVDAGNPNVLLSINMAISNGYLQFPDTRIKAHENFRLIATANTVGNGSTIQYSGRYKLDTATLNRFVIYLFTIDSNIEAELVNNDKLYRTIIAIREALIDMGVTHLISQRTSIYASKMLSLGISLEVIFNTVIAVGLEGDTRRRLQDIFMNADLLNYSNSDSNSDSDSDSDSDSNSEFSIGDNVLVVGADSEDNIKYKGKLGVVVLTETLNTDIQVKVNNELLNFSRYNIIKVAE